MDDYTASGAIDHSFGYVSPVAIARGPITCAQARVNIDAQQALADFTRRCHHLAFLRLSKMLNDDNR